MQSLSKIIDRTAECEITLSWERTHTCADLLNNIEDLERHYRGKRGVYLWTEIINGKAVANYVGKSQTCILERNIEHLYHHLSLKNSIPALYRKNQKRLIVNWLKNDGKHRESCDFIPIHRFLKDEDLRLNTIEEIQYYLQNITVYFCPLNELSDKEIQIIEAKLILSLKPLENTNGTKGSRYSDNRTLISHNVKSSILNFEKLKVDTEEYLKNNTNDPRPNANSKVGTR